MRKIMLVLLIVIVAYGLVFAASIPAPFEKAREYALTGVKDQKGIWGLRFEGNDNGQSFWFGFFYAEIDESIAIFGNWGDGLIGVALGSGNYLMVSPFGIIVIEEKEATELGFKVFRKMVELKLL